MQPLQNPNNLGALLQGGSQLLSLFAPKKSTTSTSGGTQTTQTNMSQEGLDAVLRQILEGSQGLASVARGQRQAGLFNSSTNQLLLNDFITRAAGEVAKINAPTTVTTSPTTSQSVTQAPLDLGKTLGVVGAGLLANNVLKGITSNTGKALGTGITTGAAGAAGLDLGSVLSNSSDIFSFGSSAGGGFDLGSGVSFADPSILGGGISAFGGAGNVVNTVAGLFGEDPGGSLERGIGTAVGSFFGGPIGGFLGGSIAEPVFEAGNDILGGVEQLGGNLIEAVGDIGGKILGAVGCFLTTATVKLLGKADNCEELEVLRAYRDGWLKDNHPEEIQAYYDIAPAILEGLANNRNTEEVLKAAYDSYILPAVEAVKEGRNEEAYEIYTNMVATLSKAAAIK